MSGQQAGADVVRVTAEQIPAVWTHFERQISRALSTGAGDTTNEALVYRSLVTGDAIMLAAVAGGQVKACLIYSIQSYPAKSAVLVEILAGRDLDQWCEAFEHALEAIREAAGADTIEAVCRPGLSRMLKRWRYKATLMELDNGRKKRR